MKTETDVVLPPGPLELPGVDSVTARLHNRLKGDEAKVMAEARKAANLSKKKARRQVYVTKPGFVWNPLLRYPRNEPCPCGSGMKFKKCHLDQLPQAIPKGVAQSDARIVAKKQPSPPAQPATEEVQQPTTEKTP